jgi:hypothetical protein
MALVYARKQQGPRLYIGAQLVPVDADADEVRELVAKTPIGEWFDELDITVQNPRT